MIRTKQRLLRARRRLSHLGHGYAKGQGKVILVAGIQRSGTNMLMDALEKHPDTNVIHEYDKRAFDLFFLRGIERINELHQNSRAPFFVLKILQDAHRIDEIREHFSDTAVIWAYRNFRDVVNSHLLNWPGFREKIDEIANDRSAGSWRSQGLTDDLYALLQRHYHPDMNDESCVALFWYLRNALLFTQGLDKDSETLVLNYESLVTRPDEAFKTVTRHIGMPYKQSMHSFVHARSISKRPPPEIRADIEELCEQMAAELNKLADEKGRNV